MQVTVIRGQGPSHHDGTPYAGPVFAAVEGTDASRHTVSNLYTTRDEADRFLTGLLRTYGREGIAPTGDERVLCLRDAA